MSLPAQTHDRQRALADFRQGLAEWSIWTLLGVSDIRQRYKRSKFGQLWITLSQGIFIGSIGLVYAYLFRYPTTEFIPYLAVNMVVWTMISGIVMDSTGVFVQSAIYLRQDALPKTVFVMRVLVRNTIIFLHNIVIIPIVFVIFQVPPSPTILLAIPGFFLLLVAAFLVTLLLGIVCTRFRDLPQIIQNLLQIAFFITPIMWKIEQMGDKGWIVVGFNPFAVFLRIVAEPLRGSVPGLATYGAAFVVIGILFAITWPLFVKFRSRIVYWL